MESKPVAALITVAIASIGSLTGTSLAAGKAGARAYVECGNPRGPAENVTATNLGCADARSFARKVARRGVTRSQSITLPGWHSYYATVRRVGGKYDMRATRADKVIRFQYRRGSGVGGECDPNYAGACLRPDVSDYDCEGGSGDGPYYTGRVEVVGDDHYELDRDGDGVACED
jgi:hypothetical protein